MSEKNKSSVSEHSISFQTITFGLGLLVGFVRGFFSLFILARILHVKEFGVLGVIYSFVNLAAAIVLMGTSSSIRILIPGLERPERESQFWGLIQSMGLISIVTIGVFWFAYNPVHSYFMVPEVTRRMFLVGLLIIPLTVFELLFQAQMTNNHQGREYVRLTTYSAFGDLGLSIIGAYYLGAQGVLYSIVISKTFVVVWLSFIIQKNDPFVLLSRRAFDEFTKFYRYGFLIFISGLSARVIDSSSRFAIAHFLGSEAVGFFQVAYNLCGPMNRVAAPIYMTLMPFLVIGVNSGDHDKVRHYLKTAFQLLLVVFCPMVLFLSLNSHEILQLMVTKGLSNGWTIIPFAALGILVLQVGGVYNYNILAHQKVHLIVISTSMGAAINVGLNLLLVPQIGIVGAAIALLCSYLVTVSIDFFFSQRITPFYLEKTTWIKVFVCLAAMACMMFLIRSVTHRLPIIWQLAITGALSTSVYGWGVLKFNLLVGDLWIKIRDSLRSLLMYRTKIESTSL